LEIVEKISDPKGTTPKVKLHPLREKVEKILKEKLNYPVSVTFDCSIPPDLFEVEF